MCQGPGSSRSSAPHNRRATGSTARLGGMTKAVCSSATEGAGVSVRVAEPSDRQRRARRPHTR